MIDYRENNKWIVYVHIIPKAITGYDHDKYYVGITSTTTTNRWGTDGNGYKRNMHFWRAIQKYGWNNIEHEIIAEHLTHDEACEMEIFLIKSLNSKDKNYGFNRTDGGEGSLGVVVSEETRRKFRENSLGEKNPFYNKRHSEETKNIMRVKHYDCKGDKNPSAKRTHVFDSEGRYIGTYSCLKEAVSAQGVSSDTNASASIKNHYTYSGFIWAHDEDVCMDENGRIQYLHEIIVRNNRKDVFQFDENGLFIERYDCARTAANQVGSTKTTISNAAQHGSLTKIGFYWRYEDAVEKTGDGTYMMKGDKTNG